MQQRISRVIPRDGTAIAYERSGHGPPVILVMGAFNDRGTGAPLAEFLAPDFTVFTYDRRGRGDSGDTAPYAVEREIDDLAALLGAAGGSAAVFGFSSGAVLGLQAAAHGLAIAKLALYDAPFDVDGHHRPAVDHAARLAALVQAGRRGDAVEYFQSHVVGLPAELVAQIRHAPVRPALELMAHTLVYDMAIIGDGSLPTGLAAAVQGPVLVIDGGDFGRAAMRRAAQALAAALPDGRHLALEEQHHQIVPGAIGPALRAFFAA
jgi:hypothetical protein